MPVLKSCNFETQKNLNRMLTYVMHENSNGVSFEEPNCETLDRARHQISTGNFNFVCYVSLVKGNNCLALIDNLLSCTFNRFLTFGILRSA